MFFEDSQKIPCYALSVACEATLALATSLLGASNWSFQPCSILQYDDHALLDLAILCLLASQV